MSNTIKCPFCNSSNTEVYAEYREKELPFVQFHCKDCDSLFDEETEVRENIRHNIYNILAKYANDRGYLENHEDCPMPCNIPLETEDAIALSSLELPTIVKAGCCMTGEIFFCVDGDNPIDFDDFSTKELKQIWDYIQEAETTPIVWVVLKNEIWDGENWDEVVGVFYKEEDACLALRKKRDEVFSDWKDEVIDEDSHNGFHAYKEDYYSEYHIDIYMEATSIQ